MATPSSILTCEIPWIEQLGELQSKGLKESGTTEHTYTCKSHISEFFICNFYNALFS